MFNIQDGRSIIHSLKYFLGECSFTGMMRTTPKAAPEAGKILLVQHSLYVSRPECPSDRAVPSLSAASTDHATRACPRKGQGSGLVWSGLDPVRSGQGSEGLKHWIPGAHPLPVHSANSIVLCSKQEVDFDCCSESHVSEIWVPNLFASQIFGVGLIDTLLGFSILSEPFLN